MGPLDDSTRRVLGLLALPVAALVVVCGLLAYSFGTDGEGSVAIIGIGLTLGVGAVAMVGPWLLAAVTQALSDGERALDEELGRPHDVPPSEAPGNLGEVAGRALARQRARLAAVSEQSVARAMAAEARATALEARCAAAEADAEASRADLLAARTAAAEQVALLWHGASKAIGPALAATDLLRFRETADGTRRLLDTTFQALTGGLRILARHRGLASATTSVRGLAADPERIRLRSVIGAALASSDLFHGRDDIEIVLRFAEGAPNRCLADELRLTLVLELLAHWALERATGRAVFVNVSGSEDERGEAARVTVALESEGLPLDELDPVGPDAGPEPALVAVARALLEPDGGVFFERRPGGNGVVGFTVAVRLEKQVGSTSVSGLGAIRDKAVLVVDDVAASRSAVSELLGGWSLLPTAVGSGAEALESLRAAARIDQPFDLLIVDRAMPEMDGEAFVREIVADATLGRQRIVLLDSLVGRLTPLQPDVAEAVSAVVLKPILPHALLEHVAALLSPRTVRSSRSQGGAQGRALRLLVAEDNPVNQIYLAQILEKHGHIVAVADNGAAAIDLLEARREPFDAVLMDLAMPVLDGLEATTIIRDRERRDGSERALPIIAVTARPRSEEERQCAEAGANAYLAKPLVEERLLATIHAVVSGEVALRKGGGGAVASDAHAQALGSHGIPVFDEAKVLDFVAGDREFLDSLVTLFVETSPKQVDAIARAIASEDIEGLHRAAHQLKGSVGNFAAEAARQWALELETIAREDRLEDAPFAFERLAQEIDRLASALEALARREGGALS